VKQSENILLIDSTQSELFVALAPACHCEVRSNPTVRTCNELRAHDRNLNKLTADLIDKADAFAVVVGPGSWTGSRVGVVAVKAYAIATGKPIIALQAAGACHCEQSEAIPSQYREALIAAACRKFAAKEFTAARELAPFYNAEFKATPKKP